MLARFRPYCALPGRPRRRPVRWPLLLVLMSAHLAWAQKPGGAPASSTGNASSKEQEMQQLLAFSRPASQHALLSKLVGTWHFQDVARSVVQGTLRRTPLYEGRFYQVDITGGKLQIPVADGQLKEATYQSQQLEGYWPTPICYYLHQQPHRQ